MCGPAATSWYFLVLNGFFKWDWFLACLNFSSDCIWHWCPLEGEKACCELCRPCLSISDDFWKLLEAWEYSSHQQLQFYSSLNSSFLSLCAANVKCDIVDLFMYLRAFPSYFQFYPWSFFWLCSLYLQG